MGTGTGAVRGVAAASTEAGAHLLTKQDYLALRSRLPMEPAAGPTLLMVCFDLLLLWGGMTLLAMQHWSSFLLSQVLLAIVFFNSFSILHDCGHGSVFRRSWLNTCLGHYASLLCCLPYFPWKYLHSQHHAWTGNVDRDPTLKSIRTWRQRGVPRLVRWCWWSWVPLAALAQHLVFLGYPLVMWRSGRLDRVKLLRSVGSVLWIVACYTALALLAPQVFHPRNFALAVVLFLAAEELVNSPHHADLAHFDTKLPVWEQPRATRSCYYPPWVSELLVLNFNFHIEHHLFPALPWHRLRQARRLVREALGAGYRESVGISWNLIHRRQDLHRVIARREDARLDTPHANARHS